jgi:hypothetical protein
MSLTSSYFNKVYFYYKTIDGRPFLLTPGQEEIFRIIYEPSITRGSIRAITQYGKSDVASMAVDTVATERREKILIIGPSQNQSDIIMGKIIDHLFDNPMLTGMIDYSSTTVERLRQERSKERLTFKNGSEVRTLTAQAKYISQEAKSLMGFGATIVLVDESSLIPDSMFGKILRMVGGVEHGKLIQLGNPFESNHFGKSFEDKRYVKLTIDWHQALAEHRVTQEFLDEAKENMSELDWTIFYECKFPVMGVENAVIPEEWINLAVNQVNCQGEHKQSGLDVARFGRDKTVYLFRQGGEVKRIETTEKMDNMEVVGWVRPFLDEDAPDIHVTDIVGVGAGVNDRLTEIQGAKEVIWGDTVLIGANVGESATSDEAKKRFYNLRAEVHWNLRDLFKPDKNNHSSISIPDDPELKKQLKELRYNYSSERTIKIEAKEEMKKRLGVSPDKADALGLAFFNFQNQEPTMFIVSV